MQDLAERAAAAPVAVAPAVAPGLGLLLLHASRLTPAEHLAALLLQELADVSLHGRHLAGTADVERGEMRPAQVQELSDRQEPGHAPDDGVTEDGHVAGEVLHVEEDDGVSLVRIGLLQVFPDAQVDLLHELVGADGAPDAASWRLRDPELNCAHGRKSSVVSRNWPCPGHSCDCCMLTVKRTGHLWHEHTIAPKWQTSRRNFTTSDTSAFLKANAAA